MRLASLGAAIAPTIDYDKFSFLTTGEIIPEVVQYCFKNYTTTYHNQTYFSLSCDGNGNSRYTEYSDVNSKNHFCHDEVATYSHLFNNSFLGFSQFDECKPVRNTTSNGQDFFFMTATCGADGFPSVSIHSDEDCSSVWELQVDR